MGAPVTLVPQGGRILSRPRREGLYDQEPFLAASTTITEYNFFNNTRTTSDSSGTAKVAELDTNLIGAGGSVTRGYYVRIFGVCLYLTRRGTARLTAAGMDDKRKIVDASWVVLKLGSTPYMFIPTHRIPAGANLAGLLSTTENNTTAGDVQNSVPMQPFLDLTTPGKRKIRKKVKLPNGQIAVKEVEKFDPRIPLEFGETENFTFALKFSTRPTITTSDTINMVMYLPSIFLKPLAG